MIPVCPICEEEYVRGYKDAWGFESTCSKKCHDKLIEGDE